MCQLYAIFSFNRSAEDCRNNQSSMTSNPCCIFYLLLSTSTTILLWNCFNEVKHSIAISALGVQVTICFGKTSSLLLTSSAYFEIRIFLFKSVHEWKICCLIVHYSLHFRFLTLFWQLKLTSVDYYVIALVLVQRLTKIPQYNWKYNMVEDMLYYGQKNFFRYYIFVVATLHPYGILEIMQK